MVNYEHPELFYDNESVHMIIVNSGATVTPVADHEPTIANADFVIVEDDIVSEEFRLEESICSQEDMKFGLCEASHVQFTMYENDDIPDLKDVEIVIYIYFNEDSSTLFKVGTYVVDEDKLAADKAIREVSAYDILYYLRDYDITEWYETYFDTTTEQYPLGRIGAVRNSLFDWLAEDVEDFAVAQETRTLVNDDFLIERSIESDTITFGFFMSKLLEANGAFGHINRDGKFDYIYLDSWQNDPVLTIEEENLLLPFSCEDFNTWSIGYVSVYDQNNKRLIKYGSSQYRHPSIYNVIDNFVFTNNAKRADWDDDFHDAVVNLREAVSHHRYRVFDCNTLGNLCYEVGDRVDVKWPVYDAEGEVERERHIITYILERVFTGIQGFRDNYVAKGHKKQPKYSLKNDNWHVGDSQINTLEGVENIAKENAAVAYILQNTMAYSVGALETIVMQATFNSDKTTCAIFNGQAKIVSSDDAVVTVKYYLDNEIENYIGEHTVVTSGTTMLHLYNNFTALDEDTNYTMKVTMSVSSGTISLDMLDLNGSIICYNLKEMRGYVMASDIAVAHPTLSGTSDMIWVAYVENGVLKVTTAEDRVPILWHKYSIPKVKKAKTISMAFNASLADNGDGTYQFVTDEKPYIAYIRGAQLHVLNLNNKEDVLLASGNVDDVSLVRSPKLLSGRDYGFTAFFLMENVIYYRQFMDGVWYDAEAVDLQIPDVTYKSIEAFVTWDYRTGILVTDSDGNLYQIISYFEGLTDLMTEHIEVSANANVLLSVIQYLDAKEPDEHILLNATADVALLWAWSAVPVAAVNIEDEHNNWGTTVVVTFDHPNTASGLLTSMFVLTDSAGNNYVCESATVANGELTLVFDDFNLAELYTDNSVTITYTKPASGGLLSPAVQTDSFTFTFTPVNLVPPAIDPPTFLSATNNAEGTQVTVHFTEEITNADVSGMTSNFSLALKEYNYVPDGTLQDTSRSITQIVPSAGTSLSFNTATLTDTEMDHSVITLEVENTNG